MLIPSISKLPHSSEGLTDGEMLPIHEEQCVDVCDERVLEAAYCSK